MTCVDPEIVILQCEVQKVVRTDKVELNGLCSPLFKSRKRGQGTLRNPALRL